MEDSKSPDRLFGTGGLILLSVALLGPWIIAALPRGEGPAIGFGLLAGVLALVFGLLGRRHKTGKVAVVLTGVVLGGAVLMAALAFFWYFAQTTTREKNMQAREQTVRLQRELQRRSAEAPEASQ